MNKLGKTFKRVLLFIILLIAYLYIGGVLVFAFDQPSRSDFIDQHPVDRFYHDGEGPDRVVLIEQRLEALLARLDLIRNAENTLDIAYYRYFNDYAGKLFFHALSEAADRGVQVRLLVDGQFVKFQDVRKAFYALTLHDNIEIHIYEPINLLLPWTIQNRLHDKFMIADQKYAMIGGRNIQYRFYAPDNHPGRITNDLDVLIINTSEQTDSSVIPQMSRYFDSLWSSSYTKPLKVKRSDLKKGKAYQDTLEAFITKERRINPHFFQSAIDWLSHSYPTRRVTLIHNPIERLNKEPWIWYDLTRLVERAESSVFILSPYVVPTRKMLEYIDDIKVPSEHITFFTNSIPVNPNRFGMMGYMKRRNDLVDKGYKIYEYQGPETFHGKAFMIDERLTLIGSFNLDARSTFLSTESMVVIDSVEFAEHFKTVIENKYLNKSLLVLEDYTYGPNPIITPATMKQRELRLYKILGIVFNWHDYMI